MKSTNLSDVTYKQTCDLAEFKIVFLLCIGLLAIFSSFEPTPKPSVIAEANMVNTQNLQHESTSVVGFIKREGASGFTASKAAPEWARRAENSLTH